MTLQPDMDNIVVLAEKTCGIFPCGSCLLNAAEPAAKDWKFEKMI